MVELKPCPFCGGEAEFLYHSRIKRPVIYDFFRCGCKECGLRYPKFFRVEREAIEAWNRREGEANG